ncbi:pyridoxamine 5'-phosphate oxidase family protein [Eisenibacter elegans]|jgi:hypothetical protein|uniref:pyridoxamine 5'-phosphate oxidase family protein n=1 Tax=Eisenibacter elegans TaxID=997 RepID=UPI0003F952FB|nr:pyridoxamine 5'-phosphate oxidase family protein [Eisenibacter elegans]
MPIDIEHLSLEALETDIWQRLVNGSLRPKDYWHTGVLGTFDGQAIRQRTVVLRQALPSEREVIFHTDYRSEKYQQLCQYPALSWLFYHPRTQIQLRLEGQASLHHNDTLAANHWQKLSPYGRKLYNSNFAPGSPTDSPQDGLPTLLQGHLPELPADWVSQGQTNFAVVRMHVVRMEWLCLHPQGHRRAHWNYSMPSAPLAQWLIP